MTTTSPVRFNKDKLLALIDKHKSKTKENFEESRIPVAFLPEGIHKIRFFVDPEGEIVRTAVVHAHTESYKNPLCTNYLRNIDPKMTLWKDKPADAKSYPDCSFCEGSAIIGGYKYASKNRGMAYGWLEWTSSPGDYWQPGKAYLILSNGRLKKSLLSFINGLAIDVPDFLVSLLDPQVAGGLLSVEVTRGTQGNIAIQSIPGKTINAIELGPWYKPLNEVYIPQHFVLEDWEAAVKEFQEETKSLIDAATTTEGSTTTEPVTTTPQSSEPVSTPVTPQAQVAASPAPAAPPAGNTVTTSSGEVVTLPPEVIAAKCWKQYNEANPPCVTCPIQVECLTEVTLG